MTCSGDCIVQAGLSCADEKELGGDETRQYTETRLQTLTLSYKSQKANEGL